MKKGTFLLILSFLFLAQFLTTPKVLLFFDAPEYVELATRENLLSSVITIHHPARPVFMALFWIGFKIFHNILGLASEFSGNLVAFSFGLISIYLFHSMAKLLLGPKSAYFATLIFILFPGVWIINTNLLSESVALTVFLSSALLFIRYYIKPSKSLGGLYVLSIIFLVGSHIQAILWTPAMFSLPFLFGIKSNDRKDSLSKPVILTTVGLIGYLVLFIWLSNKSEQGLLAENLQFLSYLGNWLPKNGELYIFLLRALRNIFLVITQGYGNLTAVLLLAIVLKKRRDNRFLVGLLIFILSFITTAWFWTADFIIRRSIFAGAIFALLLANNLKVSRYFVILYLLVVTFVNAHLYLASESSEMPISKIRAMQEILTSGKLIQTQYLSPFTKSRKDTVWVEHGAANDLEKYLRNGEQVYLDSQALYVPYLLYVGNNLHITSLGKIGNSDTKHLFGKYVFDLEVVEDVDKRIFIYSINESSEDFEGRVKKVKGKFGADVTIVVGKSTPGSAVYIYSDRFFQRIHRQRIDYGDIFTWAWVIFSNRREPLMWGYADKDGIFMLPVKTQDLNHISVSADSEISVFFLKNNKLK